MGILVGEKQRGPRTDNCSTHSGREREAPAAPSPADALLPSPTLVSRKPPPPLLALVGSSLCPPPVRPAPSCPCPSCSLFVVQVCLPGGLYSFPSRIIKRAREKGSLHNQIWIEILTQEAEGPANPWAKTEP